MSIGWEGQPQIFTDVVCNIDWACLWENINNVAVWLPALYGLIVTIVAATPTDKDDKVLSRLKNVGKTLGNGIVNASAKITEMKGKKE